MFLDRERFKPAAEMRLSRDRSSIRVTITDPKACELGEAVYAWITAHGKAVKIGTCGASAGKRLLSLAISTAASRGAAARRPNGKR